MINRWPFRIVSLFFQEPIARIFSHNTVAIFNRYKRITVLLHQQRV